jgi:hypothetical protein
MGQAQFSKEQVDALLARAAISLGDLSEARDCLSMCRGNLDDPDPDEPLDPLLAHGNSFLVCYAAISYSRPFVKSRGSGAKFLTFGQMGVQLSDELSVLHARILDLRDKAFAHSDSDLRPAEFLDTSHAPISTRPGEFLIGTSYRTGQSFAEQIAVPRFRMLIDTVRQEMLRFVQRLKTPNT